MLEELMCTKIGEENENKTPKNSNLRWADAVSKEETELYKLALRKRSQIHRISRKYGLRSFDFGFPTCLKTKKSNTTNLQKIWINEF